MAPNASTTPSKRSFIWALSALVLLAIAAGAYLSSTEMRRKPVVVIYTFISYNILDESIAGIKEGLLNQGYTDDKIDLRTINANGEREKLNAFAKEALAAKPDVLVPVSTPVAVAVVQEAGATQPIVFSTVTNPADVGMDRKPPNLT